MDADRFDALSRSLITSGSRRRAIAAVGRPWPNPASASRNAARARNANEAIATASTAGSGAKKENADPRRKGRSPQVDAVAVEPASIPIAILATAAAVAGAAKSTPSARPGRAPASEVSATPPMQPAVQRQLPGLKRVVAPGPRPPAPARPLAPLTCVQLGRWPALGHAAGPAVRPARPVTRAPAPVCNSDVRRVKQTSELASLSFTSIPLPGVHVG
jgi:hypothetical protein